MTGWSSELLSMYLPIEDIIDHPNERWDRYNMSSNPTICLRAIHAMLLSVGIGIIYLDT
jgi:hypothetical protein